MQAFDVGSLRLEVESRSITALGRHVGALVSSDDNDLSHGGGVSMALWDAAGPELDAHVAKDPAALKLGDVHVTPAFALDADVLLHAITIDFDAHRSIGPGDASTLFGRVLDTAATCGCASVALPLLGTGLGRLNRSAAATALAEAIDLRAAHQTALGTVVLSLFGGDEDEVIGALRDRLHPRPPLGDVVAALAHVTAEGRALADSWRAATATNDGSYAWLDVLDRALDVLVARGLERLSRAVRAGTIALPAVEGLEAAPNGEVVLTWDRPRPPGARLDLAARIYTLLGETIPASTIHAARSAVACRNQVVHASIPVDEDLNVVRRAVELLLTHAAGRLRTQMDEITGAAAAAAAFSGLESGVSAAAGALRAGNVARALWGLLPGVAAVAAGSSAPPPQPRDVPSPEPTALVAEPPRRAGCQANSHVRKLHRLLLDELPKESLDEIVDELRAVGYRGDAELCLLEYCVRMEDPAAFLATEIGVRDLRRILKKVSGATTRPDADDRRVATELLEWLGFPRTPQPRGLASVRARLARTQRDVGIASARELRGAVTEASAQLEFLVQVMLRFLCRAAFRRSPESYFRANGRLAHSQTIDRSSLGKLLELLEALGRDLAADHSPSVRQFNADFEARRLVPSASFRVVQLRNSFAHFDREPEDASLEEQRRKAASFFEEAIRFVDYVGDPKGRVFPIILRIERLTVDRHGRRTIEAVTDDDQVERIFTDDELAPGQIYLMHPVTNPLRVDPILVMAGDVDVDRAAPAK